MPLTNINLQKTLSKWTTKVLNAEGMVIGYKKIIYNFD